MAGNILVDDVLASCYASTHHDLAHIGMTPIRPFPSIMDCIFGEDDGSLIYAKLLEEFGKLMAPYGITYGLNWFKFRLGMAPYSKLNISIYIKIISWVFQNDINEIIWLWNGID